MKIFICIVAAAVGLFFGGLVAVICEDDERKAADYDSDSDGGFIDDWRLP